MPERQSKKTLNKSNSFPLPPNFEAFSDPSYRHQQPMPLGLFEQRAVDIDDSESYALYADYENETNPGQMNIQMLRSAGRWSLGRKTTERSIYECYLEEISKAESFVYIENQFVISSTSSTGVENQVVLALYDRICRAINEGKPFKVIIFLPLLPAFEANLEKKQGKVMQIQIGLENATIGLGEDSLFGKLEKKLHNHPSGVKPEYYLMVCGLRTWDFSNTEDGIPKTELIYIHSKVDLFD